MSEIDYVRESFEMFYKNMSNNEGLEALDKALTIARDILDEDLSENQIIRNLICKACASVIEYAQKLRNNGTPSNNDIHHALMLLQEFLDYGFASGHDFETEYAEVFVMWGKAIHSEIQGTSIPADLEASLRATALKNLTEKMGSY